MSFGAISKSVMPLKKRTSSRVRSYPPVTACNSPDARLSMRRIRAHPCESRGRKASGLTVPPSGTHDSGAAGRSRLERLFHEVPRPCLSMAKRATETSAFTRVGPCHELRTDVTNAATAAPLLPRLERGKACRGRVSGVSARTAAGFIQRFENDVWPVFSAFRWALMPVFRVTTEMGLGRQAPVSRKINALSPSSLLTVDR